jgi:glycosyltransferase involved in cell wall biosynthesis
MITVSVAMATYNGAKYLRDQLDSLAAQRHTPAELVVTDDGSTDGTLVIVEEFSKTASFPVLIHRNESPVGYRANFMRAAGLCRSELIAFCDQDDIWDPRKIAICAERFEDSGVLLVYHDAVVVTAGGDPIRPFDQHLSGSPMDCALGFTQIFHRSLIQHSDLWCVSLDHNEPVVTERMAHDQWFFFLALAFGSVVHLGQRLVYYRQHGGNTYGWSAPLSFSKKPLHSLSAFRGRAERLASFEKAARGRAAILEQPNRKMTNLWRERAALASERYHFLADLYGVRRRLYASINTADRARAFCSILRKRGYRPKRNWGLGAKALIADLCLGLPVGHLVSGTRDSVANPSTN